MKTDMNMKLIFISINNNNAYFHKMSVIIIIIQKMHVLQLLYVNCMNYVFFFIISSPHTPTSTVLFQ